MRVIYCPDCKSTSGFAIDKNSPSHWRCTKCNVPCISKNVKEENIAVNKNKRSKFVKKDIENIYKTSKKAPEKKKGQLTLF